MSKEAECWAVVGRATRAAHPCDRSHSFEAVVSRSRQARRCIVGLTGPGIGLRRWQVDGHRTSGLFVSCCCYHHCHRTLRRHRRHRRRQQREGDGRICHARPEVRAALRAGSAMMRTWRLGEVGWMRVGIERESQRPGGYVRLW